MSLTLLQVCYLSQLRYTRGRNCYRNWLQALFKRK